MGAGLIFAGIVLVWAIVLAPTWIRHSDERFDPLMAARTSPRIRVLTRRRRTPGSATAAARPTAPPATARAARYAAAPSRSRMPIHRTTPRSPLFRQPRSNSVSFARRRRFVLSLVVIAAGLAVAVVLGAAFWWAPGVPLAVLVGDLVYVRGEARRAYERKRRERVVTTRRAEARRRAKLHAAAMPPITVDLPRPARINPDGTWEPVKIPLPTYVTAPVAPRRDGRPIVLGAYGSWTRRRMGDLMRRDSAASGRDLLVGPLEPPEPYDAPTHRPRAVNE